jgi:NADH dehydrogenase [ubiquinone] 1 alpha subcomplex assembly factor 6
MMIMRTAVYTRRLKRLSEHHSVLRGERAATNREIASTTSSYMDLLPRRHQQQHFRHFHHTPTRCTRPSSTSLSKSDFDFCVDLVQNRDRESYLCGLLMPSSARKSYFAIRAFNVELASIKSGSISRQVGGAKFAGYEGTSASAALHIRMQWWRDALNQIYNDGDDSSSNKNDDGDAAGDETVSASNPTTEDFESSSSSSRIFVDSMAASYMKNPVVRVLDYAVHEKRLTRRFLGRLLESREADLETTQPATLQDAVNYSDGTFSSLFYLSLETCDVRDDKADVVAQHAGIGVGLTTLLRAAPWVILQDGECTIPQDVIPQQFPFHKLHSYYEDVTVTTTTAADADSRNNSNNNSPTSKLTDEEYQMLKDAVKQIAALAYSHLSMAQRLQSDVPKSARACLLPVIPALHYLNKLEQQADYDIFDDSVFTDPRGGGSRQQNQNGNLTLLFLLGRSWLTGVI